MKATPPSERDAGILRSFARRIDPSDAGAHNNLGVLYYRKGLIDEAIEQFQGALELDSKMRVAQRNLEIAYRETGFYDRRIAELRETLRRDPDDRDARWGLGRAYASVLQYEEALAEFHTQLSRSPNDAAVVTQIGLVEKRRGNLEDAAEWFDRVIEIDQNSSVGHFLRGEALYNQGLKKEALRALVRATELNPDNAEAHYLIAFMLGEQGDHEDARAATKKAIELNPAFGRAQTNLSLERHTADRAESEKQPALRVLEPERDPMAHYQLGIAFRRQGYLSDALREFRMALDQGENRFTVLEAMAEVHLLKREYDTALARYDTLLNSRVASAKLWNEQGVVLHQLGRLDEAVNAYQVALDTAPGYALAYNNLGVTLAQQGNYDGALVGFRGAIEADPSIEGPRLNLGHLFYSAGQFELAEQVYRQVVDRNDQSAGGWGGLGVVLSEQERLEEARNAFARAVEIDPDSAEAQYNLSFALSALGDYDGALRAVTKAQTVDPYYRPKKFRLAIDLQYEDSSIAVIPEISGDVAVVGESNFTFDADSLDQFFTELAPAPLEQAPAEEPAEDAFAMSRDYLSKGLLDLATGEANRALARGADPAAANELMGQIFARRGLPGEALDRFREARRIDPERHEAGIGEVRALIAVDRASEAAALAGILNDASPDDVEVLVALAEAQHAAGKPAEAMAVLEKARERAPQRADILKIEGAIAIEVGDYETARRSYEDALILDPGLLPLLVSLGRLHEVREDFHAAEAAYRAAVDGSEGFPEAKIALASLYVRRAEPKTAVNLLVELLTADPTDLDALVVLGHALLEDERFPESRDAFRRVLAFDDLHVEAHYHLGASYANLREFEPAIWQWHRVVALDPSGRWAERARRHIRSAADLGHLLNTEAA